MRRPLCKQARMPTRDDLLSGIIYIRARDYLEQVKRAQLMCPTQVLCGCNRRCLE